MAHTCMWHFVYVYVYEPSGMDRDIAPPQMGIFWNNKTIFYM